MTESILLKNCRYLITEKGVVHQKVDVLIEEGTIAGIGECSEKTGIIIDCSKKIVIPGLINCHTHIPAILLRDLWDELDFEEYSRRIFKIEKKLGSKLIYLISKLAIYGMLSTGTTIFTTTCLYPLEVAKAASDIGVRAVVGPAFRGGCMFEESYKLLRELKMIKSHKIKPALGVYFFLSCSSDDLSAIRDLLENMHVYFHVSETRREVYEFKKTHGVFPVEYLDKFGLLTARTRLVHLGWATSWELEIIKNRGASVIHCPTSDMIFATGGFLPFKEMSRSGIVVGLGTDGGLDMFEEMRSFILLQRNNYLDIGVKALDALRAATIEGGKITEWKAGRIAVNSPADLVLVDAESIHLQPLNKNVLQSLVYLGSRVNVDMVIIDGKIVYQKEDMPKIREETSRILGEVEARLS